MSHRYRRCWIAIAETHLGKTILISNRSEWTDERIIEAYRSQFLIEAMFREMKSPTPIIPAGAARSGRRRVFISSEM